MKTLLCTGGIGSGKSFVVQILQAMGCPAYDCDARAKALYDEDPALLQAVVALAGADVLGADGRLDRKALAAKLFANSELRSRVEDLVHPAVIRDFTAWRDVQTAPLPVLESAILLEHPQYRPLYDKVLVVSAPEEVRIARVMARDGVSREAVLQRMASQWSEERRRAAADFIIENDGEQALLPQLCKDASLLSAFAASAARPSHFVGPSRSSATGGHASKSNASLHKE